MVGIRPRSQKVTAGNQIPLQTVKRVTLTLTSVTAQMMMMTTTMMILMTTMTLTLSVVVDLTVMMVGGKYLLAAFLFLVKIYSFT